MGSIHDHYNHTASESERCRDDDVTASEVASYAFCAKAWHLEHVLGRRPSSAAATRRSQGIREHVAHGASVTAGRRHHRIAVRVAVLLALCAAACLTLALVLLA